MQEGMALFNAQGINVRVMIAEEQGGETEIVPYNQDGELGCFDPGDVFYLELVAPKKNRMLPIVVHRHMSPDGSHHFGKLEDIGDGQAFRYRFAVIVRGTFRRGRTESPNNQIIVVLFGRQMQFSLVQVGLATQRKIYLRTQVLFRGQLKQDFQGKYYVGPSFQPWSNLLGLLIAEKNRRKIVVGEPPKARGWDWVDVVPETVWPQPPPQYIDDDLPKGFARVQFWNECNSHGGAGIAVARHQDGRLFLVRIHWSALANQNGFATLSAGDLVRFKRIIETRHTGGPDQGKLRYELTGVHLIQQ